MKKSDSYLKNFLLFLASIILVLVIAEVVKYVYDQLYPASDSFSYYYKYHNEIEKGYKSADVAFIYTERGRRNKPFADYSILWSDDFLQQKNIPNPNRHYIGSDGKRRDIRIKINSLGFRDDEINPEKNNENRILMLGDSITMSCYLEKDKTFVELFEQQLNKNNKNHNKYQVINAGMGDIGIAEEVEILRDTVDKVKPDMVGIGFYLNDSLRPWSFHIEKDFLYAIASKSRFLSWVWFRFNFDKFMRTLGKDRFNWVKTFKERKWIYDKNIYYQMIANSTSDWGAAWQKDSWKIIESKIDEILSLGKKHNFKTFLFCLPTSIQVESNIFDDSPQQTIKKICQERNIPFLDLLPILIKHKDKNLFLDQCHINEIANRIVADTLMDFYKTNLFPQKG